MIEVPFPDPEGRFQVHGLYWWEEVRPHLWRLPQRHRDRVTPVVSVLSEQPCGARVVCLTDARTIWVRVGFPAQGELLNLSRLGRQGLDYYVDGAFCRGLIPSGEAEQEFCLFDGGLPGGLHDITVYLAQYGPQEILALRYLPDSAVFEAPTAYALPKPLAVYGSSITQGGCSSRPSLNWPARLARSLNLDLINLGMSGGALGEPFMWEIMAEIDACCYILDYGINITPAEKLEEVYAPFVDSLRAARPEVPVVCVSPIFSAWEAWGSDYRLNRMRGHIRQVCEDRADDPLLFHVAGLELLGPDDRDGICDASHANDIGFKYMAERMEPTVRRALSLGA